MESVKILLILVYSYRYIYYKIQFEYCGVFKTIMKNVVFLCDGSSK